MHSTIPIIHLTEKQRKHFSCGTEALDCYFRQYAKSNHLRNIGKTFVLVDDKQLVIGFYTTSMSKVDFSSLPTEHQLKLPRYPVPVALIGRLAVNVNYHGQGWGTFLLVDALKRIQLAANLVAAYGIVVEAKDDKAKSFYTRFGFKAFVDNQLHLFMPLASVPEQ